jgi:hypothetical protein
LITASSGAGAVQTLRRPSGGHHEGASAARPGPARDLLKRERLSPLPIKFQMARLVAFNEGLLEQADPDASPALLERLALNVRQSELSLDDHHPGWAEAVSAWIAPEVQAGHNKRLTGCGGGTLYR